MPVSGGVGFPSGSLLPSGLPSGPVGVTTLPSGPFSGLPSGPLGTTGLSGVGAGTKNEIAIIFNYVQTLIDFFHSVSQTLIKVFW